MNDRDFSPLLPTMQVMKHFEQSWFFVGGWALDLAAGYVSREHHDVDICVFREDVALLLNFFKEWERKISIPGEHRLIDCFSEQDTQPPRHELHFAKGQMAVEVLLIDKAEKKVLFRRDPSIWMSYGHFARTDEDGRPFVAPEWQLLFKAKNPRFKDELDFRNHAPGLDAQARQWLMAALDRHVPASSWIEELENMITTD